MTNRAKTTAASTAGSFAPDVKAEPKLDLAPKFTLRRTIAAAGVLDRPVEKWTALDYLTANQQIDAGRNDWEVGQQLRQAVRKSHWTFETAHRAQAAANRTTCPASSHHSATTTCLTCHTSEHTVALANGYADGHLGVLGFNRYEVADSDQARKLHQCTKDPSCVLQDQHDDDCAWQRNPSARFAPHT